MIPAKISSDDSSSKTLSLTCPWWRRRLKEVLDGTVSELCAIVKLLSLSSLSKNTPRTPGKMKIYSQDISIQGVCTQHYLHSCMLSLNAQLLSRYSAAAFSPQWRPSSPASCLERCFCTLPIWHRILWSSCNKRYIKTYFKQENILVQLQKETSRSPVWVNFY